VTEKIEWFNPVGSTLDSDLAGDNWFAQGFTPGTVGRSIGFILKSAKLLLHAFGTPTGQLTVSIKAAQGINPNAIPTGPDIVSASMNANAVPAYVSWVELKFSSFPPLDPGTNYFIVARAPSCDGISSWIAWVCYSTGDNPSLYTGGNHAQSRNAGGSWSAIPQEDVGFEAWGDPTPYSVPSDVTALTNMSFSSGTTPTDSQVQEYISRADNFIENYCGHNWLLNTVTQEMYDGIGYGPRTGMILLKHAPVLSISKVEYYSEGNWITGVEGKPHDNPGYQCYETWLDEGKIKWYVLQMDGPKVYRVTYTWGYNSPPTFIKDLSSTLAALAVLASLSGPSLQTYGIGDLNIGYPREGQYGNMWRMLCDRANQLMMQASARRPISGVG
jgi:hypothetical protein